MHYKRFMATGDPIGVIVKQRKEKHGMRWTPEYSIWNDMRRRCRDPKRSEYKYYGARGITVCERWESSFLAFYEDMGPRPEGDYTIDRIDNDGNYEPGNCRWATRKEQIHNRRPIGTALTQ